MLDRASGQAQMTGKPKDIWKKLVLQPKIEKIIKGCRDGSATYYALLLYSAGTLRDHSFMYKWDVNKQWGVQSEDDLDWSYFDDLVDGITKRAVASNTSMEDLATTIGKAGQQIGEGFNQMFFNKIYRSPGAGHMIDYLKRQGFASVGFAYGIFNAK
jgi:hypothetical protein